FVSYRSFALVEIVECAVCQATVKELDELLVSDQMLDHITEYADRICDALPAKHYTQCDQMLGIYGVSMLQQLRRSIGREQVCVNIDMCSAMSTTLLSLPEYASGEHAIDEPVEEEHAEKKFATVVGMNECSWGPSFWCKNEANAQQCKSTTYCKERKLGFWRETA
uniref:Saposin B-type domain-containing protein n=1 Tax=Anopheles maculatus TaxID=74869 RepID=A0A182SVB4_9DIPT